MIGNNSIAWLQLIHRKNRLIVTVLGVTFAVLLMFIQLGFRDGLFEDAVTIHKTLQADLVLLHINSERFFEMKPFPRRYLYNLSEIDGIASVNPLYFSIGNFKNPSNAISIPIAVCAFMPDKPVFNLPDINQQTEIIKQPNTVLYDKLSRLEYGTIAANFEKTGEVVTELSNHKTKIRGLFSLGGGVISVSGMIVTSDLNYSQILDQPLGKVHMGVVKLKSGIDPQSVISAASKQLSKDVKLITIGEFMQMEKETLAQSTPIGFIFNMGTVIGCVFGGIIAYQILYTQISDSLYIYATFKAIGYANSFLVKVVLQQAFIMSIIGYIPGFCCCLYIYHFVQDSTRLPMIMNFDRALMVLLLTIFMCSLAGFLAMNKLRSADPAELFG